MNSGSTGTPLIKKLGIKPGFKVRFIFEPDHYQSLIGPLPRDIAIIKDSESRVDFIHFFASDFSKINSHFESLANQIYPNGMLWISWYKKASKISTDLNEDIIRETILSKGLVEVKVCAIDDKWSGLKIVWRIQNR